MESKLVKILKEQPDVSTLTNENIAEYKQTEETIKLYTKRLEVPFKEAALHQGNSTIFENDGLMVEIKEKKSKIKNSPKEIITLMNSYLATSLENQKNGKQMYGVKKFNDCVAIDIPYFTGLVENWMDEVHGTSVSKSIKYKGDKVEEIAKQNLGRLTIVENIPDIGYNSRLTEDIVNLYVTWGEQKSKLNELVIKPFENMFKSNAKKSKEYTIFDVQKYDDLAVQVMSVPRPTSQYKKVGAIMLEKLKEYSQTEDKVNTFYNAGLDEPRMYVSIDALLGDLNTAKKLQKTNVTQEVTILYQPEEAIVFSN